MYVPQDSTPHPSSDDSPATIDAGGAAAPASGTPDADDPVADDPESDTSGEPVAEPPAVQPPASEAPATDQPPAGQPAGEAPATVPAADPAADAEPEPATDTKAADPERRAAVAAIAAAMKGLAAAKAARPAVPPADRQAGWDPADEKPDLPPSIPRRRGPVWARALVVFGAVLVLSSATGLIAGKALLDRYAGSVHQESLLGGARATAAASGAGGGEVAAAPIDGPLNLLLVGIDERTNAPGDGARADSIIIVHVPADHQSAYFISVPRDSRVSIPPYPKTHYEGGTDKVNAAFAYGFLNGGGRPGGFELLALTLKQLTGISFNAGAIIDFDGFRSVVDAMGGVNMCVDEQTTSVHIGWDASGKETPPYRIVPPDYTPERIYGIRPQVYQVGCQTMQGWDALDYVRQRELLPDGDYGRERHQQQFLKAIARKLTSLGVIGNPLRLDSVLRSAANTLTFDGGGYSVTDWLFNLKAISPGNITMMKTNAGQFNTKYYGGQAFEILDDTSMELFQAARDDTVDQFVQAHPDWVSGDSTAPSSPAPSSSSSSSPSTSPSN
jgi:polyisoprenyl-teichoic acid--peptidoglycan teichoic acid transferase